jgi:hypothetical protein
VAIASSFVSNYVVHLFSLKSYPGESYKERAVAMVATLFYPSFGLLRAVDQIRCGFAGNIKTLSRRQDELQQAQNAGALCMVVRSIDWRPSAQLVGHDITFVRLHVNDVGFSSLVDVCFTNDNYVK